MEKITPNQIRTGNIFNYWMGVDDNGSQWEPTQLDWQDIKWCEERNDEFNMAHMPIPITEDWLIKFGFRNHEMNKRLFRGQGITLFLDSDDDCMIGKPHGHGETVGLCHLKYVHQLQNLYFSLVGIELSLQERGEKV